MASRGSLNKVLLIGNLTRDPELRYTPTGAAVCTFGMATNRVYIAADGTKKEEAEFHRIVAWNKLAELCSQLLTKGRKVFVEGRLQTRTWATPAGDNRQTTEIVIDDMKILDRKPTEDLTELSETSFEKAPPDKALQIPGEVTESPSQEVEGEETEEKPAKKTETKPKSSKKSTKKEEKKEESTEDLISDLPF